MDKLAQAKTKSQFLNQINRLLTEDLDDDLDEDEPTIKSSKSNKKRLSDQPTTSNENNVPKKTRKIRSKDEIQKERIEKEISKIQRELNASKNSKCELYLFCHCSNALLSLDPQLNNQIKHVFTERKLENQFIFENMDLAKVYWKKKRISAELVDNIVMRKENFDIQFGFLIAVDGGAFKLMYESKQHDEFINNSLFEHCSKFDGEVRMTIAIIGPHNVSESNINSLSLTLFERYKVQLRFCRNTEDFSYLIVQIHRTLAKLEKKLENADSQIHLNVEKGIREGDNLVEDWWSRMLNHIYRLPEECRRAILEIYPNPFILMKKLDELTAGDAMQNLSNIECSNGRRVGPAIAQKLYLMMTSEDGSEVIDRPGLNV